MKTREEKRIKTLAHVTIYCEKRNNLNWKLPFDKLAAIEPDVFSAFTWQINSSRTL